MGESDVQVGLDAIVGFHPCHDSQIGGFKTAWSIQGGTAYDASFSHGLFRVLADGRIECQF